MSIRRLPEAIEAYARALVHRRDVEGLRNLHQMLNDILDHMEGRDMTYDVESTNGCQ